MKNTILTIIISIFCRTNSIAQNEDDDPIGATWLMEASMSEHKAMWTDLGYKLVKTNYEGCILTYANEDKGLNTFVDFKDGWESVDEVILTFRFPDTYNMYLEYAIENFSEEKSDGNSRFFVPSNFIALIGFSVREYTSGRVYMIRFSSLK